MPPSVLVKHLRVASSSTLLGSIFKMWVFEVLRNKHRKAVRYSSGPSYLEVRQIKNHDHEAFCVGTGSNPHHHTDDNTNTSTNNLQTKVHPYITCSKQPSTTITPMTPTTPTAREQTPYCSQLLQRTHPSTGCFRMHCMP